jgi:hypothetical protein
MGLIMLGISVVQYKVTLGHVPYSYLFIVPGLPLALGIGALIGALIGLSIWSATLITGRVFGLVGRIIIGIVSALVIVGVYSLLHTEPRGYYQPTYSWTEHAIFWLVTGILLGVLPGIMAYDKSRLT